MTYLLIITLAPSPITSQIPYTLLDIISLSADAVLCHDLRRVLHFLSSLVLTSNSRDFSLSVQDVILDNFGLLPVNIIKIDLFAMVIGSNFHIKFENIHVIYFFYL